MFQKLAGQLVGRPRERAAAPEGRLPYRPALDGIRGLAVAAVLAYHADLPFARGGFLGVDAFFVLSGYLITSLLLAEWRATGSIDLPAFWARRARRLLPALFGLLVGIAAYGLFVADPSQLDKLRGDAMATLAYFANWRLAFTGDSYFEQFALPSPLRHTWSLAIEEQWYAFWPLVLLGLLWWRRGSTRVLLGAAVVMTAASALLMASLYDPRADPSRLYYGTDTRAQSLLVGAVLAVVLARHGALRSRATQTSLQVAAVVSAAFVAWLWVTVPDSSAFLYRGGLLLSAVAVAVVIAAAVQPRSGLVGGVLSVAPLRGLGLISYGVYLWHWPIYLTLTPERTGLDGAALLAMKVGATLLVAGASYALVETPIRRGAWRTWRPSWAVAPATAALLAVGLVITTRGGTQPLALSSDAATTSVSAAGAGLLPLPSGAEAAAPTRVLLVGDSVARMMGPGLASYEEEQGFVLRDATILACGVVGGDVKVREGVKAPSDECRGRLDLWRAELDAFRPDVVVLLSPLWDGMDHEVDGRMLEYGTPEAGAYWLGEMQSAVDLLSSGGAAVVMLTPLYFPVDGLEADRTNWLGGVYRRVACDNPGTVTLIDLNRHLYPTGELIPFIDGVNVRGEGYHFSPEGADIVGRWLAPQIAGVARGEPASAPLEACEHTSTG